MAQNGADATVAKAYVQIIPSARGIKENVTDVIAKEGATAGQGFGANFGAGLKKLGGAIVTAVKVAGAAAVAAGAAITKMAVDSYADYEQLTGGIETLYKDSADAVLANAQQAFRTAGMSANEYMETVMQFSGSLLQSVGGDTVKAAQMADMALRDMSDNANKMGTDIERLQDAYRGFARGQYTMLDNLSLGYGGTRSEMERLLADAEAISGIHYDISNYADVVDAIHVIQTEMGITGTTAEEAASTISGSWGMLKASWENLLVSLAGGGDDIETSVQAVFDSLLTWLGNVGPVIAETVRGIFAAVPEMAAHVMEKLPPAILGAVDDAFGPDARAVVEGFFDEFGNVAQGIEEFASEIMDALSPLTDFFNGQGEAFAGMMERIQGHMEDLAPHLENLQVLWTGFKTAVLDLVEAVAPIAAEFFGYFASAMTGLLPIITQLAEGFLMFATGTIEVITAFIEDAKTGFEGFRAALSETWEAIQSAVGDAVQNVKDRVEGAFTAIKDTATSIWQSVKTAIETPINAARDAVKSAIDSIKSFFDFKFQWPHIPLPHFSISGSANPLDWLSGGLPHISVEWYAKGGYIDGATLIGAGERGGELIWPSYEPYLSRYSDALVESMDGGASTVNNYYIDGNLVAADAALAAALDTVAQRVGGRRRMGVVNG